MTLSRTLHAIVLVAGAMSVTASRASAAPFPFAGELPLTNEDVAVLRARLTADEFFRTVDFLGGLRVFEDTASTPARPMFYLAPFFTADPSREVIGGQQIATDLLFYLDRLDQLLASFQASLQQQDRLDALRTDYVALADQVRSRSGQFLQADSARLVDYAVNGNPYVVESRLLPARVEAAMGVFTPVLRRAIVTAILGVLDKLQIPLSAVERDQALANPVKFVLVVPTKIRAKLANQLLGVRNATFVSGMTSEQVRLLGNYRQIRPDVVLAALPTTVIRVLPISSTLDTDGPLGGSVSAPVMLRGVNSTTGGVCGSRTSCMVILEYTEIGARSALLSTRGASIMPVQFVGDVAIAPATGTTGTTPITCDIAALRRRLVLPFGFGLLGDREILRVISGSGICRTATGDAGTLPSLLLLTGTFRNLLFEPAQLSVSRRGQLPAEIARLIAGDGRVRDGLGIVSTLLRSLDLESYLMRFARTYYSRLMPRFSDDLIAGLLLSSGSAETTMRFDFDGVAIACWKEAVGGGTYLSACPDLAPEPELQVAAASVLEAGYCEPGAELNICAAAIQAPPPDPQGFLWIDVP